MPAATKGMVSFDLCAGHPALDFVNSLDNRFRKGGPHELLSSYADLLRFLEQSRLLDRKRIALLNQRSVAKAAGQTLNRARHLREVTANVLYGLIQTKQPSVRDSALLQDFFLEALRHRELTWQPETSRAQRQQPAFTWTWDYFETRTQLPLWIVSQAVSDLFLSGKLGRLRACDLTTCRWLFLDTSKNASRRWCSMKVCGNRMKARRFQALHQSGTHQADSRLD